MKVELIKFLIKFLMETHKERDHSTIKMFENATGFQDPTRAIRIYKEVIKSQRRRSLALHFDRNMCFKSSRKVRWQV